MTTTDKPVFVRKASGLVRTLSLRDILLFNSIAQGLGIGALSFIDPTFLGILPGASFWLGAALSLLAGIAITIVYSHFLSAMPRSGGEYVFLSRLVHPFVGFFFNWSMAWLMILAMAANAVLGGGLFIGLLNTVTTLPPFWYTPIGTLIPVMLINIIALLITVAGMRWYARWQTIVAIVSAISTVMLIYVLAMVGSPDHFKVMFNNFAAPYYSGVTASPYDYILQQAQTAGYKLFSTASFSMGNTVGLMVVFGFSGLLTLATGSAYIAGEMKNAESSKSQLIGLTGGLMLNGALLIGLSALLMYVISPDWMGAFYYLSLNNPSAILLPTAVNAFPFNVLGWLTTPILSVFILLTIFMLAITWNIMDMIIISRCMFAWSFDRIFPTKICAVNSRLKVPLNAILLSFVLGVIFCVVAVYYSAFYSILSAAGWLVFTTFIAVGLTAIVFPFKMKRLYELMPLKAKIGPVPVLSLLGILVLVLYIPMATVYLWGSDFASALGAWTTWTTLFLVVIYIAAIAIYGASKLYWKGKGIELEIGAKEIPPA